MRSKKKGLMLKKISNQHASLIHNWIASITRCNADRILSGMLIGNYGGRYIEVYHASETLYKLIETLMEKHVKPYAAGLHVATIKGDKITPSLPLARYLVNRCHPQDYCHTIITSKGEKLFLYGRNVLEGNIVYCNCIDKYSVVVNREREPLGWGIVEKTGKELLLTNVKDVGWYIRMGG